MTDDIPHKTLEENWRDWEANVFGFGYGTGEPHTIPALKTFLELCNEGPHGHSYDYRKLEEALTPTVAWLFISTLCKHKVDVIEYGTSPRCGWLTSRGIALKEFVSRHTAERLIEFCLEFARELGRLV